MYPLTASFRTSKTRVRYSNFSEKYSLPTVKSNAGLETQLNSTDPYGFQPVLDSRDPVGTTAGQP